MDKKRLKEKYKKKKPDMAVYKVNFNESNKIYLGIAEDLKGNINSLKFQLKLGSFRQSNNLQNEYNKFGDNDEKRKNIVLCECRWALFGLTSIR